MKLPCHLEDEQLVLFQEEDVDRIATNGPPATKLTQWFKLNREYPDARNLLYPTVPQHYTWTRNRWQKRKCITAENNDNASSDMIGRIPVISLNVHQAELYFSASTPSSRGLLALQI